MIRTLALLASLPYPELPLAPSFMADLRRHALQAAYLRTLSARHHRSDSKLC